jgi:hypothetical protein
MPTKSPVPPTLLEVDIVWGFKTYFWKRLLPGLTFVGGIALFFAAEQLGGSWPFQRIPNAGEYVRYGAIFAVAWALNSLSSFVSSLKVTTKGQS